MRFTLLATAAFFATGVLSQGILDSDILATVDCESDSKNPDQCSGETLPHGQGNDLKDVIAKVQGLGTAFSAQPDTGFGCVPAAQNPPSSFCAKVIDTKNAVDQGTVVSALNQIAKACGNSATARCGHVFINGKDKSGGVVQVQFQTDAAKRFRFKRDNQ